MQINKSDNHFKKKNIKKTIANLIWKGSRKIIVVSVTLKESEKTGKKQIVC